MNTRKLSCMAVLAALSVVLVSFVHIPMPAPISFLEYDPADVPILICGFAFGPWSALLVTVVAALIQGLTVSAQSGIYGIIMHILASGAFCVVSAIVYAKHKTKKHAVFGLFCGAASRVMIMFFGNLIITPYFMLGAVNPDTVRVVLDLMPFILLFNFGVTVVNGLLTFLLYKRISPILHKK